MLNESAFADINIIDSENIDASFNLEELESKLEEQLNIELSNLDILKEEYDKIADLDCLGDTVKDIVWEQFLNQIAITAGEDFIRENDGLYLDLSKDAHIQTSENFERGNIATHNKAVDYEKRYHEMRADFQTDPNMKVDMSKNMRFNENNGTYERFDKESNSWVGKTRYNKETKVWEDWDPRAATWKKKLAKDARNNFDTRSKDQMGTKNIANDHTIAAAEQLRDMDAAAHMDRKARQEFAKSDANLNYMDASANQSKGDLSMSDWLDKPRADGQTQAEHFGLDEEKLRKDDAVAREEYDKIKSDAEKQSIESGKQSRKDEAFKMSGKALRTAAMQLLLELIKEITVKLVKWFKSAKRRLDTLVDAIKSAILSFVSKLKTHLLNAGNTMVTTIATAIIGPIVGTIKKVWIMLKQGWNSLREAINYIRNPENRSKPVSLLILEVGEIVTAGATGVGAIILGEAIEKGLMSIPIFAAEIPLIGSLASLLGIFFGAVVAGIIGAIIINLIQRRIEGKLKTENEGKQMDNKNQILNLQNQLEFVKKEQMYEHKEVFYNNANERHYNATIEMKKSIENIVNNNTKVRADHRKKEDIIDDDKEIEKLLLALKEGE